MTRYWTTYWQNRLWCDEVNSELTPFTLSGSNLYRKRGVSPGDNVFVVSVSDGQLYLGGRMIVGDIVSRDNALKLANSEALFELSEWIVARDATGTPLALDRRLAPAITRRLRFLSPSGTKGLVFMPNSSNLDVQTLRGVRELSLESGRILDRIVEVTDRQYKVGVTLSVTAEMLGDDQWVDESVLEPDDTADTAAEELLGLEGELQRRMVQHRHRERRLRDRKLETVSSLNGGALVCEVPNCGFDFRRAYGALGAGYAQVHHRRPLSEVDGPVETCLDDLAIVCANCHVMIHRDGDCRPLEELRVSSSGGRSI